MIRRPWLLWLLLAAAALACWVVAARGAEAPYRRADWPHWRTVEVDGLRCSVRVHVLRRDAQRKPWGPHPDVDTGDGEPCTLLGGLWIDRYTGRVIGDPRSLDVDHVLPLEFVHRHGGSTWTRDQKAAYANYLGYRWHLLTVSASENRRKGSKGPSEYVPPDRAFHCQYGQSIATILVIWKLQVDEPTRRAIAKLVESC